MTLCNCSLVTSCDFSVFFSAIENPSSAFEINILALRFCSHSCYLLFFYFCFLYSEVIAEFSLERSLCSSTKMPATAECSMNALVKIDQRKAKERRITKSVLIGGTTFISRSKQVTTFDVERKKKSHCRNRNRIKESEKIKIKKIPNCVFSDQRK